MKSAKKCINNLNEDTENIKKYQAEITELNNNLTEKFNKEVQ